MFTGYFTCTSSGCHKIDDDVETIEIKVWRNSKRFYSARAKVEDIYLYVFRIKIILFHKSLLQIINNNVEWEWWKILIFLTGTDINWFSTHRQLPKILYKYQIWGTVGMSRIICCTVGMGHLCTKVEMSGSIMHFLVKCREIFQKYRIWQGARTWWWTRLYTLGMGAFVHKRWTVVQNHGKHRFIDGSRKIFQKYRIWEQRHDD